MATEGLDLTTAEFSRILRDLEPHLPISDAFEQRALQGQEGRWDSQRTHMTKWFAAQSTKGTGAYTRDVPNSSAKRAYNRLQCPEAMIWIAEALGAPTTLVQQAVDEMDANPDRRVRSRIIRQFLPWEMIAELARSKGRNRTPMARARRFAAEVLPRRALRRQ